MEVLLGNYYSQQGLSAALNIYNFPDDYKYNQKFLSTGLRYLFRYHNKISYEYRITKTDLERRAHSLFNQFISQRYNEGVRETADIISHYCPNQRETILQRLREYDEFITRDIITLETKRGVETNRLLRNNNNISKPKLNTVYSDSQNVHSTKINNSVNKAIQTLYQMFKAQIQSENEDTVAEKEENNHFNKLNMTREIQTYLLQTYSTQTELIKESIEYINNSPATFTSDMIGMIDCFLCVWLWIVNQDNHKNELEKRLLEEFREMRGQCATGHVSRLINVLQGFTDNQDLIVQISDTEQYTSVIKTFLNKKLSECDDEKIHEQMITGGEHFVSFIKKQIQLQEPLWIKEYGTEIKLYIPSIVNIYTNTKIFNI